MPFPKADYEKDFEAAEDLAEFRVLLRAAGEDWLALEGHRASDPDRAYEAVGRYVVRNSDVLIAIWDGTPGSGRGGTADIVAYAAASSVPMWWLHATADIPAKWIADGQDLRDPLPNPPVPKEGLHAWLATAIRHPPARDNTMAPFTV